MSSKWANNVGNQTWKTPHYFFDILKENFNIRLDACTDDQNHLGTRYYYTEKDNGLVQPWFTWTYCNPPYAETSLWVRKAYFEMYDNNISSLLLIPNNSDTNWYHNYIWNRFKDEPYNHVFVKIIHKRIWFDGAQAPAKFSSILVIFSRDWENKYINLTKD